MRRNRLTTTPEKSVSTAYMTAKKITVFITAAPEKVKR